MTCKQCKNTGEYTRGTGHPAAGYRSHTLPPEGSVVDYCDCAAGRALRAKDAASSRVEDMAAIDDYIEQKRKERDADLASQGLADCIQCMLPADLDELKDNCGLCRKCGRIDQ